ncbi:MAG: hypothetical protein A2632_00010 [Candidatus Pacebacteria bacterium RIFCSPHIGHO2_01_FULL_46_16]|nr:MAG: hypothetical protein A2632_00010 [Candidatus Pacebacteria bacterium RIFCSPHIGHO2_01_FULL_46_16]OGJ20523.1 MAG: hypothetical protein A3J60_00010 [Candidatus Pacebacteria bacterium RIFCSPHIGHO2_02_FULL_46_9]OGJ39191.1 MAG: hypothetical protein A3A82_00090 [Candidatus Pacebacteria bacterium RIFCSPLOWO2_01_FULL_47_12]
MKQTILSAQQSELLERLVVKYDEVVTTKQIYQEAIDIWNQQQTKKVLAKLVDNGWLIRIKRGLYIISDFSNRGFLSLSPYIVASLLVKDSYVSFESALSYYGMLDQLTSKIISIAKIRYKTTQLDNLEYRFAHTKDQFYFGWQEVIISNKIAHIATAEKALIDMIHFHKSKYAIDLVIEKLKEHKDDLHITKLSKYISRMSTTTIKIFGVIFDLLAIDSSYLYEQIKTKQSTQWMLVGDKKFNAKWRLYYDEYFDKYQVSTQVC